MHAAQKGPKGKCKNEMLKLNFSPEIRRKLEVVSYNLYLLPTPVLSNCGWLAILSLITSRDRVGVYRAAQDGGANI